MSKLRISALLLAASLLPHGGFAQSPVLVNIAPCMAQTSDAARLACYDRLGAETQAVTPSSQPPATEAAPATVNDEALAAFGRAATPQVVQDENGQDELLDRIVDMREREPGRWLFTLASGQRWIQTNSGRIPLRKGMDVRIYPSPLGGSYRMAAQSEGRGFVQVQRVE